MRQTSLYHPLRVLRGSSFTLLICLIVLLEGSFLNPSTAQFGTDSAPDFSVETFEGESFSNYDFEGGQALLMFWAPWCDVCRGELPKLTQYYQSNIPDNLQVLAIGTSASHGEVEQYVTGHPETFVFPTGYDANKRMARDFGIRAFPTYVLLDGDGMILLVHRGSGVLHDQKFQQLTQ